MSSGNGRQRIWCQTACFSGARVVKRIQDAPAEILRVGKRTVQRWEAAKTIPNLAQHALEYVTMLLAEAPLTLHRRPTALQETLSESSASHPSRRTICFGPE